MDELRGKYPARSEGQSMAEFQAFPGDTALPEGGDNGPSGVTPAAPVRTFGGAAWVPAPRRARAGYRPW